jgi:hypothetical protein
VPLRSGYSRATVGANIAAEMDAGRKQSQAVAMALRSARKFYRARHPVGAYPAHLKNRKSNPGMKISPLKQAQHLFKTNRHAWMGGSAPPKNFLDSKVNYFLYGLFLEEQINDFKKATGTAPDTDTVGIFQNRALHDAWATVRNLPKHNPISEATAHKLRRAAPGTFARMTDEQIKRAVKVKRRRSKARRNPAPLTKKSYVTRKSQITQRSPTRRLKKRRTKNWALGRRRVFPNPGARYIVQAKVPRSFKWVMLATYPAGMKRDAFQHARDYAKTHPTHTVRVNLE